MTPFQCCVHTAWSPLPASFLPYRFVHSTEGRWCCLTIPTIFWWGRRIQYLTSKATKLIHCSGRVGVWFGDTVCCNVILEGDTDTFSRRGDYRWPQSIHSSIDASFHSDCWWLPMMVLTWPFLLISSVSIFLLRRYPVYGGIHLFCCSSTGDHSPWKVTGLFDWSSSSYILDIRYSIFHRLFITCIRFRCHLGAIIDPICLIYSILHFGRSWYSSTFLPFWFLQWWFYFGDTVRYNSKERTLCLIVHFLPVHISSTVYIWDGLTVHSDTWPFDD